MALLLRWLRGTDRETCFSDEDQVPDAPSRQNGGLGLEPAEISGARIRSPRSCPHGVGMASPESRAGGIRPGAKPVSRCHDSDEKLLARRPGRD